MKKFEKSFLPIMFAAVAILAVFGVWQNQTQKSPNYEVTKIDSGYPPITTFPMLDISNWLIYKDDKFGFEFKHPPHTVIKTSFITPTIRNCPPEVTCGPEPLYPYINVEINNSPGSKTPAEYYEFRVSFKDTPIIKPAYGNEAPGTYVSAFPGDPIDLSDTSHKIITRLMTVFLDVTAPEIIKVGDEKELLFLAFDNTFFPHELIIRPLQGPRYSHIYFNLGSGFFASAGDENPCAVTQIDSALSECIKTKFLAFRNYTLGRWNTLLNMTSTFREFTP